MTDIKKIIEDLEYARYHCTSNKGKDAINDAIDLINRQQAENERLNNCVKSEDEVREIAKRTMEPLVREITREQIDTAVKLAKSEAYKEFAERLKALDRLDVDVSYGYGREHYTEAIAVNLIDNLVKEIIGEE